MKTETFIQKHHELLALVNEVLAIPNPTKETTELLEVKESLQKDLFNYVLIGQFQGGKSTVANVFCDGREISPRGLGGGGVKTSSCKITFRSLNDNVQEELALVTWKTDEELVESLRGIINNKYQTYDLSNPLMRSEITSRIDEEVEKYRKNPYRYQNLDLLHYALLVDRFYSHPLIIEERKRSRYELSELQTLVKFPESYNEKWEDLDLKYFSPEEVRYVFIKEIECFVQAENLKRVQSAVVDCPGLFVSDWDSAIAKDAMRKSDAIWLLLSGGRELDQGEQMLLQEIQRSGWKKKTILSINAQRALRPQVLSAIVGKIRAWGWGEKVDPLYTFNAFLALRAEQGEKYLLGKLDEQTREIILQDAREMERRDFASLEEAWVRSVNRILSEMLREPVPSLTFESVEYVRECSDINRIINYLYQYSIRNKSESLLIDNGASKLNNILIDLRRHLELTIESAQKEKQNAENEWTESETKLKKFQEFARAQVRSYLERDEAIDIALREDYWERVYGKLTAPEITNRLANQIIDKITVGSIMGDQITRFANFISDEILDTDAHTPELNEQITELIHNDIKSEVTHNHEKWIESIKSNENDRYQETIRKRIVDINQTLRKRWNEFDLEENKLVERLKLDEISGNVFVDSPPKVIMNETLDQHKSKKMLDEVGVYAGGVGIFIAADLLVPGLGVVLAEVFLFIAIMLKDENKEKKQLVEKLDEQINLWINNSKPNLIENIHEKITSNIRRKYIDIYASIFDEQTKAFHSTIEKQREFFNMSNREQQESAKQAARLVAEKIKPLETQVSAYIEDVKASL